MKFAKNLFRFSTAIKHKVPLITQKPHPVKFSLATGLGLATAYWFTNKKIMGQEMLEFQLEDNLAEGQMRELQVGPKPEDTVLLTKYHGKVFCTQSKCSHFGYSLAKGFMSGDKVMCPLHNAGFSVKSGKPEQGPVFNGLKTFKVVAQNGKIKVSVPKNGWDQPPPLFEIDTSTLDRNKKIVIIGAGPAALSAADTLRQTGYTGYIYMITRERETPYDRTMLSKMSDAEKKPGPIRSDDYYSRNGIIFVRNSNVTGIDYDNKKVKIGEKDFLAYDKLLIASGCVNKVPPIKGLDKVRYNTLRTVKDYQEINKAVRENGVKNITIIGGGFIGLETASAIKAALKDQVNVTIIETQKTPLQHVLGEQVGSVLKKLAQKNGVNVITSAKIKQIKGEGEKPTSVVLEQLMVPTDALVVATGVKPQISFAQQLQDKELSGIKTNIFLETEGKGVFAAGDIASYPYWYTGQRARIEHYNEAIYQGSVAALNMLGKRMPMDNIPFFWTRSFNSTLSFTGYARGWDQIHITGDLNEPKFVAYYIDKKTDKVLGVASMGVMNQVQIINQAMRNGEMPPASKVKSPNFKIEDLVPDIKQANPKCTRCSQMHP